MKFLEFIILLIVSIPVALVITVASFTKTPPILLQASTTMPSATSELQTIGIKKILLPSQTPIPLPTNKPPIPTTQDVNDWGVAKQIGKHTYTIKVNYDGSMASPQEILSALNAYRQTQGKGTLNWDQRLADYANSRAQTFKSMGTTDAHAGFENFLNNEDGFSKMGFNRLGENSYFGGGLTGTHLIEWVFSQSPGHNANQLDSWSHVGIGTTDTSVNLNFGGN